MQKRTIVIGLLIGLLVPAFMPPGKSHAQAPHIKIDAAVIIPNDPAFEEIRIFYKNFNFSQAIKATKKLSQQRKDKTAAQKAAFLLGELYTLAGDKGEAKQYKNALNAFTVARRTYPHSEEAIVALWKMGSIYSKKALHYEAIATFNRIIKKYPDHPVALASQLGKGRAYHAINKMKEAIQVYDEINPSLLSDADRRLLLLSYGDAFYKLGYFNTSYEYYKLVPVEEVFGLATGPTIYHYGIAALQSNDYKGAREIFSLLGTAFSGQAEALMGLARIGDSWRLEGMSLRAELYYKEVEDWKKEDRAFQKAKLVAAIGEFHLAGCFPKPLLLRQSDCDKMKALESEQGRLAEQKIKDISAGLIDRIEEDPDTGPLLWEAVAALERHQAYTSSLWIKEKYMGKVLASSTRSAFEQSHPNTAIKSVEQLMNQDDRLGALSLFFRHLRYFSSEEVEESIVLRLGVNLFDSGFYPQAVSLLTRIAESKHPQVNQEALYYLIQATFHDAHFEDADRLLQRFVSLYPQTPQVPYLEIISGEILERQDQVDQAVAAYGRWLKRYSGHPESRKVHSLLATAYEKKGDLKAAIATYLKIDAETGKEDPNIALQVADLYYRIKDDKAAITYYQKASKGLETPFKKEWATLQLANSFERLGQREKGSPLYTRLAGEATDDLIQGLATQKTKKALSP